MHSIKQLKIRPHLLAWGLFILYEVSLGYVLTGVASKISNYILFYSLNIGIFYFHAHVVLDRTLKGNKRSYLLLVLLFFVEMGLYFGLKYILLYVISVLPFTKVPFYLAESTWRAIYFIGLSTAYWSFLSIIDQRKQISELENQKLRRELDNQLLEKNLLSSENAYLKSQINPHFLFNTLNFLYNSAAKFSDKTAETIMLLSDMMRYALSATGDDGKVELDDEINHINNLIELNQARFNDALQINFMVSGDPSDLRIIPLSLLTLVENVFKYGDMQNEEYPVKIEITIKNTQLTMITENRKRGNSKVNSHGIGTSNLKRRLDLYYANKYSMEVDDNETGYTTILKMEL